MEVKILKSIASADFSYRPGQLVILNDDLAKKWAAIELCELIEVKPEVDITNLLNDDPDKRPKRTRK